MKSSEDVARTTQPPSALIAAMRSSSSGRSAFCVLDSKTSRPIASSACRSTPLIDRELALEEGCPARPETIGGIVEGNDREMAEPEYAALDCGLGKSPARRAAGDRVVDVEEMDFRRHAQMSAGRSCREVIDSVGVLPAVFPRKQLGDAKHDLVGSFRARGLGPPGLGRAQPESLADSDMDLGAPPAPEVAPKGLAARMRDGDDRRARAQGHGHHALVAAAEPAVVAPRALRHDVQHLSLREGLEREPHRGDVVRAAIHGNAFPYRGKETEERIAPGLGFREAGDVAGVEIRVQQRGLEEVHVVRDEDKRALTRDLRELGAVQLA